MLELRHVTVNTEDREIVHDISLSIPEGTVSVLMGPNGSGKSSLVNGLMGHPHYAVSSGELLCDGEIITKQKTVDKAKKGLFLSLQQIPKIEGLTLTTFLHKAYCDMHNSNDSILDFYLLLRKVAEEFSIPLSLLDRPLSAGLSGGEKKLSEVLQLAILRPKYAILDEIDSGVDVDALRTVFSVIAKRKKEGTGFLIITHHYSLLDHLVPEYVHVMAQGELVCSGEKELMEMIHKKGFCTVVKCDKASACKGVCA